MRPYDILDVFTGTPLAGNPLAVVHEADGLTTDRMQAIAAEFNLSETIFLSAPDGDAVPARIFTPREEFAFAGHPTVGGSIALSLRTGARELALHVPAGRVDVSISGDTVRSATLGAPLPSAEFVDLPAADLASLIGLMPEDVATDDYRPAVLRSGPGFTAIPLRSVKALEAARYEAAHSDVLGDLPPSLYLIAKDAGGFRTRMFAPLAGIAEDPATGAAAVGLAALIAAVEAPSDGSHSVTIIQGVEMGRTSEIGIASEITDGALRRVMLSGQAVLVAQGSLLV